MHYVYVLRCPKTNIIRYVGRTNNPQHRFKCHKARLESNVDKFVWIESLIKRGLQPLFEIVFESADKEQVKQRERELIARYAKRQRIFNRSNNAVYISNK